MVVAEVIRVRNNTLSTYIVQGGDPFYTPQVDGKPAIDGVIEVVPGFDQPCEGLVVPWEKMTRTGLVVVEETSGDSIRVVVGPVEEDADNRDWLQFRNDKWEPLSRERWLPLGRRHYLGAVGGSVDIHLTFRDARAHGGGSANLVEVTHFEKAVFCAPANEVFLNIFDLSPSIGPLNAILCNTMIKSIGLWHAAVEVYGEEWAFYRTPNAHSCGVCKSLRPRHHPVHAYRQSINLGATTLKDWEVRYLIRARLAPKWLGGNYDILNRNCIHFCEALALELGVKPLPRYVTNAHETGASLFRIPWPLSYILGGDETHALTNGSAHSEEGEQASAGNQTEGQPPPDANFIDLSRDDRSDVSSIDLSHRSSIARNSSKLSN